MATNRVEPVYITKDGTRIPYLPETITTARDAYAATLHVLFRHVSDFHLCVVSTISKRYNIPEDEIMETIHESEEFKKLTPDQALVTIFDNVKIENENENESENQQHQIPSQSVRTKSPPKKVILKKKRVLPPPVTNENETVLQPQSQTDCGAVVKDSTAETVPKVPNEPKALKVPKEPKAQKAPKEPKEPKVPKAPKAPKESKVPKDDSQQKLSFKSEKSENY